MHNILGRWHNNLAVCPMKHSHLGHTSPQNQLTQITLNTLASLSKIKDEKEKQKKKKLEVVGDLKVWLLKLFPDVCTLPSSVALSLVKAEIKISQFITRPHFAQVIT